MHQVPMGLLKLIWQWIKNIYPKIRNYRFRPKLKFDVKQQRIVFISKSNKEQCYKYFCLLLNNPTNKQQVINLCNIFFNNEKYQVLIQTDPNFSKIKDDVIQHAKGTVDQQLMGPPKTVKTTYQTPSLFLKL